MQPIHSKKSLGQNFLTDRRIVGRIVESVNPQAADIILEIGPGKGALTVGLAENAGLLRAVETDARLIDRLRASLPQDRVEIILADALEVDWASLIDSAVADWRTKIGSGISG
ncbi:MAG TPA: rRNA adenine N-6-methyltransferase family protein, partial [Blastocatellia bacterium]